MTIHTPEETKPSPEEDLNTARATAENAAFHADELRARMVDGDPSITPDAIDTAEKQARHAALTLEAAKVAYQRAFDQRRRDAWPVIRDERLGEILEDPAFELSAALDKLAPRIRTAVAELQAALTEAMDPVVRHNDHVGALRMYVAAGGYTDPADNVVQHGGSVNVSGRGCTPFDPTTTVDMWLSDVLPARKDIAAWLDRVRVARLLASLPDEE